MPRHFTPLAAARPLTSANSINIARWIPQATTFASAVQRLDLGHLWSHHLWAVHIHEFTRLTPRLRFATGTRVRHLLGLAAELVVRHVEQAVEGDDEGRGETEQQPAASGPARWGLGGGRRGPRRRSRAGLVVRVICRGARGGGVTVR